MDLLTYGDRKYPQADVRSSSSGLKWAGIAAELRRHSTGEVSPGRACHMEVAMIVRRDRGAFVSRKGGGERQDVPIEPRRIWLCPIGVDVEFIRFERTMDILHFYLDPARFDDLSETVGGARVDAGSIRYLAGLQDDLIGQIGASFLTEMREETAGGKMLIETLALALTARLAHRYAQVGPTPANRLWERHGLDAGRLDRVVDHIVAHIDEDLTIERLAAVACVSPFHFIRMFKISVGAPPHRYVSGLRLERAKAMLADHDVPIVEIAAKCRFSSQPNFSRAFRRATGLSPGAFRKGQQPG